MLTTHRKGKIGNTRLTCDVSNPQESRWQRAGVDWLSNHLIGAPEKGFAAQLHAAVCAAATGRVVLLIKPFWWCFTEPKRKASGPVPSYPGSKSVVYLGCLGHGMVVRERQAQTEVNYHYR